MDEPVTVLPVEEPPRPWARFYTPHGKTLDDDEDFAEEWASDPLRCMEWALWGADDGIQVWKNLVIRWKDLAPDARPTPVQILLHSLCAAGRPHETGRTRDIWTFWRTQFPDDDLAGLLTEMHEGDEGRFPLQRLVRWASRPSFLGLRPTVLDIFAQMRTGVASATTAVRSHLLWHFLNWPPHFPQVEEGILSDLLMWGVDLDFQDTKGEGLLIQAVHSQTQMAAPRKDEWTDWPLPQDLPDWWKGKFNWDEWKPEQFNAETHEAQRQQWMTAITQRVALLLDAGLNPMASMENGAINAIVEVFRHWSMEDLAIVWPQWRRLGWRATSADHDALLSMLARWKDNHASLLTEPGAEPPAVAIWYACASELLGNDAWWTAEQEGPLLEAMATWPGFFAWVAAERDAPTGLGRLALARLFPGDASTPTAPRYPGMPAALPVFGPWTSALAAWIERQPLGRLAAHLLREYGSPESRAARLNLAARLQQHPTLWETDPTVPARAAAWFSFEPFWWPEPVRERRAVTAHPWTLYTEPQWTAFLEIMKKRDQENVVTQNWVKDIEEQGAKGGRRPLVAAKIAFPHVKALRQGFPHFAAILDRIEQHLALAALGDGAFGLPPLLLLGPPGTGKTFFFQELASAVHTDYHILNLESVNAGFALTGSEASWSNAAPGYFFERMMLKATVANPIFLLDEIDKCGGSRDFPVEPVLLNVLEPHSAAVFTDRCLPLPLDLRRVTWVATANDLKRVSLPLQSRFEIMGVPNPDRAARRAMAQTIYSALRRQHAWGAAFEPDLPVVTLDALAAPAGSSRNLRKHLTAAFGRAALAGRPMLLPVDFMAPADRSRAMPWDAPLPESPFLESRA
jgi:ATP-dependent Lon protease